MLTRKRSVRLFGRMVLIAGTWMLASLFVTPAFTAANSVGATKRGEGAGEISGYRISDVHYNLNSLNPEDIDSVTFRLDSAPAVGSTIKIRLVSGGTEWYACSVPESPEVTVTCPTTSPAATLAQTDELTVVVSD